MKNKQQFSIIELMTVIMVILVLMSLIIPAFSQVKMNARTSICRNQMRQIGILIGSYQSDNDGFLPNDAMESYNDPGYRGGARHIGDIPYATIGNNQLYQYWNGHLLPYLDINLPDKYTRYAMLTKAGSTRSASGQLGGPMNPPPSNPLKNGWAVVDDAFQKGGYNDLRVFICPEIHQNTFDVDVSNTYNGLKLPRITQLCNLGFSDRPGYDYGMGGGIPTTYLANEKFFGFGVDARSYRADQIKEISKKVFHVEGGLASPGGNYEVSPPYYMTNTYSPYTGGALIARFDKGSASVHKLSFVHDNYTQFWVMSSQWWYYYFPSYWGNENWKAEIAAKFNVQFKGKASMVLGSSAWTFDSSIGYDIVSYVNPYLDSVSIAGGSIFDNFFTMNNPSQALRQFVAFTDDPNEYHYLVGDMNVLFGDGSVAKKDAGWLCNNRFKISLETAE